MPLTRHRILIKTACTKFIFLKYLGFFLLFFYKWFFFLKYLMSKMASITSSQIIKTEQRNQPTGVKLCPRRVKATANAIYTAFAFIEIRFVKYQESFTFFCKHQRRSNQKVNLIFRIRKLLGVNKASGCYILAKFSVSYNSLGLHITRVKHLLPDSMEMIKTKSSDGEIKRQKQFRPIQCSLRYKNSSSQDAVNIG